MANKKILICSIDAPFIGGAGTNSYNLIKLLRQVPNYDVTGLYFYKDESLDRDPHKIGMIHKYNPNRDKVAIVKNAIIKDLGGFPDLILAKNYIAVLTVKKFFSQAKLYFLPSGSSYYGHYCSKYGLVTVNNLITLLEDGKRSLSSVVDSKGKYPCWPNSCQVGCDCETRAYVVSDKIIPNSQLTERLFCALYGEIKTADRKIISEKINPAIETSALYDREMVQKNIKQIPFDDRDYDVVFACYNWRRGLKNIDLVNKVIQNGKMKSLKVLVIGHESKRTKPGNNKNVKIISCINNSEILGYLAKTRCYVCPSYYDSYPNMITEADLCGCNIVTSINVGQCVRLSKSSVVGNFEDLNEWSVKILAATRKRFNSLDTDQQKIIEQLKNVIDSEKI